jgi:quinol monooxygenase YgiN
MNRVILINTLSVKPGRIDEFVATQQEFASAMRGRPNGLLGGRLYRSNDGNKAVLISQFESPEAQKAVLQSPEFQAHIARLREMVESASPSEYVEAYTYGDFR